MDPVLAGLKDVNHETILKDNADVGSAAVLFRKLPRLLPGGNVQNID